MTHMTVPDDEDITANYQIKLASDQTRFSPSKSKDHLLEFNGNSFD